MKKDTQCIHSGTFKDRATGGVNTPIYTSSSFAYLDATNNVYPRYFNTPNQRAVIDKLSTLENTEDGVLFSSGMAAIGTVLFTFLKQGDHIVLQRDVYGGTYHYAMSEFDKFGIDYTFVSNDIDNMEKAIRDNTKVIYIESPSNPLLKITDMRAVAELAGSTDILTAIDNTFATPINQNPHDDGIDIVIHSGTKYLGGHSDICCGAALGRKSLIDKIMHSAINFGGSLNASTCYLLERSLKTLSIRIERQCANAQHIAESLQQNSMIRNVYYPGLESHEGHELAKNQMKAFGAVVSFELDNSKINPDTFIRSLKLVTPALSLGGIETLICQPATTSHEKMKEQDRLSIGITKGLFRLSVGIEDKDDILADIEQAFENG